MLLDQTADNPSVSVDALNSGRRAFRGQGGSARRIRANAQALDFWLGFEPPSADTQLAFAGPSPLESRTSQTPGHRGRFLESRPSGNSRVTSRIDHPQLMSDAPKKMVIGSMVVAGLVGLLAICDLAIGIPFSGSEHTFLMDILFIVCSAILGYLAYDAYKDLR
jgi:hypothetical protein